MTDLLKHMRRPQQGLDQGRWSIRCDCGWSGSISATKGSHVLRADEIEQELEACFVDHLPAGERESYILVDVRPVPVWVEADEGGHYEELPRGNFIMPIGTPINLLKHWTADQVRWGSYLVPSTGQSGQLPIGEIRTADNRVFKMDAPA